MNELQRVAGHHDIRPVVLHVGTHAARNCVPSWYTATLPSGKSGSVGKIRFCIAWHASVPLQYAALHNNFRLWSVNSALLSPGTSYIAVGDYISSKGLSTEQLRDKTHEALFELLKLSPEFDPLREQPLAEMARARGHGL